MQNTLSLFGLGVVGVRSGEGGGGWERETGAGEWKLGEGDGICMSLYFSALF